VPLTDAEIIELEHLYELRDIEEAKESLFDFTRFTMPEFAPADFHEIYYTVLDLFAKGYVKKLMVTMGPQHGKSEGSTRRLPAYILGRNYDAKIAIASYNATFAEEFNTDIQKIIDSEAYHKVFPETCLNESNVVTISGTAKRNSRKFEIVNHRGFLKAVGRGGALTGSPVDIMIMDDLYKDYEEGNSPIVRESVWNWYKTVVKTRLHNDSQELIVFTRWHEDDLIGKLEEINNVVTVNSLDDINRINPSDWVKINFEAIKDSDPTEIDPREKDTPLWPEKHSLSKLRETRDLGEDEFSCLYQGDPTDSSGLLYGVFETYTERPKNAERKNYTDTADKGTDYLCSIDYDKKDGYFYVVDIVYTDEPMEVTEFSVPKMLLDNDTRTADIESNNGGRGFARVVQKQVIGNCKVNWFHQGANKEARIIANSSQVTQLIKMPHDWIERWPVFAKDVRKFKRLFRANKQDGGPDVLTGIIEKNRKKKRRRMLN